MDSYKCYVAGKEIEVDNDVSTAAQILISMKYSRLDEKTTKELQEMIKRPILPQKGKDESRNLKVRFKINVRKEFECEDTNAKSKSQKLDPSCTPSTGSISLPSTRLLAPHNVEEAQPLTSPPLPALRQFMGMCSRPLEKQITPSDVRRNLCRLMLKKSLVEERFLPLLNPDENISNGIPVIVYGPDGREYAMTFIFWCMKFYVLNNRKWNEFCQDYDVQPLMWATVWMFHHNQTSRLCFAINLRRPPAPVEDACIKPTISIG